MEPSTAICCNYNVLKIGFSLFQLLFGVWALNKTWGDQIARFGLADFGLTAAPYAWMSLLNLIGSLVSPQYPTKFVVGGPALDRLNEELRQLGVAGRLPPVDGNIGRISWAAEESLMRHAALVWSRIPKTDKVLLC